MICILSPDMMEILTKLGRALSILFLLFITTSHGITIEVFQYFEISVAVGNVNLLSNYGTTPLDASRLCKTTESCNLFCYVGPGEYRPSDSPIEIGHYETDQNAPAYSCLTKKPRKFFFQLGNSLLSIRISFWNICWPILKLRSS